MAALYTLQISGPDLIASPFLAGDNRGSCNRMSNLLTALAAGNYGLGTATIDARASAAKATGTVTMASSSGTVGAIINGVTVSVTWATSDTVSAALLATAINASVNALVAGFVTATSALGVVTLTATQAGISGNAITLAATGTNVTASGARLTAGAETLVTVTF